jgi:hypothetical protein
MAQSERKMWQHMLRRLKVANDDESNRAGGSIFSRLFAQSNVDSLGDRMALRAKKYSIETLLENNVTAGDLMNNNITFAKAKQLGYTLRELLALPGFNTDVVRVMAIDHRDMLNEKDVCIEHPQLFKPILKEMFAANAQLSHRWDAGDLFNLNFRDADWVSIGTHNFWPSNSQDCTQWHTNFANYFTTPQRIRVTAHPGRAVGPQLHADMPRIKVNLSGLL